MGDSGPRAKAGVVEVNDRTHSEVLNVVRDWLGRLGRLEGNLGGIVTVATAYS